MKKILKIFYNTILLLLGLLIVLVGATLIPIPRQFGGQAGNFKVFVVQSGSMEPAVKTGSLIFVKPGNNYAVGDVVTVKNGKNTVTHRIIEKKTDAGENIFATKGDANEESDTVEISQKEIVGKMLFILPYLGYPVGYAKTKVGFMFLVIIPAIIIIYDELHRIKREIVKTWKEKKKKKEEPKGYEPTFTQEFRITGIHDGYTQPKNPESPEPILTPSSPKPQYPQPLKRRIV